MRVKGYFLFLTLFLSLCLSLTSVSAAPVLFNPVPGNETYTSGGSITFSINITENNLNTSSVYLYIISEDSLKRGYDWDVIAVPPSACIDGPPNWFCSVDKSFATTGDDTREYFYFKAADNSGAYGVSGTFNFILDVNAPKITAVTENNTYAGPNKEMQMRVCDGASKVNASKVMSLCQNETWNPGWKQMKFVKYVSNIPGFESCGDCCGNWVVNCSTLDFPNNSTSKVRITATDKVGNSEEGQLLTVLIDNEQPSIDITNLVPDQTVRGVKKIEVDVKDAYAGIDISNVSYSVDGHMDSLDCTGSPHDLECSKDFNSTNVSDGTRTVTFYAYDNATNLGNESIQIEVYNKNPDITSPSDNAHVRNGVYVNATVSDPKAWMTGVKIILEKSGYDGTWKNMECSNWNCSYFLNTTTLSDGTYTVRVNVTNTYGYTVGDTISVKADNTDPSLTSIKLNGVELTDAEIPTVNGSFDLYVTIRDDISVNQTGVRFEISNFSVKMGCEPYGEIYGCAGSFNSSNLGDGAHILTFSAKDIAGNEGSESKTIIVNNTYPSGGGTPGGGTPSGGGTPGGGTPSGGGTPGGGTPGGGASCGDRRCTPPETCLTCPKDCGQCPNITPGIIPANLTIPQIITAVTQYKYSPVILAVVITSVMLVWYFLGYLTRKVVAPTELENLEKTFREERVNLEFLYGSMMAGLEATDLEDLKKPVNRALASLDKIKKEQFLLDAIDKSIKSVKEPVAREELIDFARGRIEEIYASEASRKWFIEKISGLLSDVLKTNEISAARKNLNEARQVYVELIDLIEKEVDMCHEYTALLRSLTTKKDDSLESV